MARWFKVGLSAIVAWSAALGSAAGGAPEEDVFWHDVTLRLEGALPNTREQLSDHLELYLGRTEDGEWRKYVLGFSALFFPQDLGRADHRHYNWMDYEGTLLEVKEDGDKIHLLVDMTIHPDPWVCGGTVGLDIHLTRSGNRLTGTYTGDFDKAETDRAGPAGHFETGGKVTGTIREDLWPSPVPGHVPPGPGEHPRLLFRKTDLPALRKRMETPEGKVILARLQKMLETEDPRRRLWHGYGYGLMYQLTGDKKWADVAREYAEGAVAGKITVPRWGWFTRDGGYMRVAPSVAAVAAAYDMCYDGWEPDFRRWVARKIQDRIYPCMLHKPDLAETDGQFDPQSNHYMLWNGGAGLAILAITGDPGTDSRIVRRSHRIFMRRLKRGLVDGFGDHGWFYEGTFCGRFPTNGALTQYLQAMRVADGKDYVTNCSEARWLTTKWIYEVVRSGGKVVYHTRGMYKQFGWPVFTGDFSQGFGIIPEEWKPAVLWFYQKVIEPGGIKTYDARGPKQAVYAFVNWPIGMEPKDPAGVLGTVLRDEEASFWVLRSGWQGEGDIIVNMHGNAVVLGMGLKTDAPGGFGPQDKVTYYHHDEAENATVVSGIYGGPLGGAVPPHKSMAVDFSGLSGAPAMFVAVQFTPGEKRPDLSGDQQRQRDELAAFLKAQMARGKGQTNGEAAPGGPNTNSTRVTMGGNVFTVTTMQKGAPPEVKVVGEGADRRIVVGERTIRLDGRNIVLGRLPETGEK